MNRKKWFFRGMRDGIPISLGYFAVAIALGIAARNAGMTPWQATLSSLLLNASAGEYVGFTLIAANASYIEIIAMEAIANLRYLLMSCSLSQKLKPGTGIFRRLLLGTVVTDEIFGISIAVPEKLDPIYSYGAILVAVPGWALGTLLGVVLGNVLPVRAVSALSVSLYGMFIAIFIPPARKNRVVAALIPISFLASFVFSVVDCFKVLSSGIRTILLTVVISLLAAIFFPIKDEKEDTGHAA